MRWEKLLGAGTDERWGQRMRRYREEADLTMEEATVVIDQFLPTSAMTVSRLEKFDAPPKLRRQRAIAALALAIYGIHPERSKMGLSISDLPAVDVRQLERELVKIRKRKGTRGRKSAWSAGTIWTDLATGVA